MLPTLRTAFRSLAKSPGYAAATILILALGVGANAAIFSIVRTTLLGDLPFPDSERLVRVWETFSKAKERGPVSLPDFEDWRREADAFESLAAQRVASRNLQGVAEPERIAALESTASLFEVLGVHPALGRFYAPEEERPEAAATVVLAERFWRRRFAADPAVVGTTVSLDGVAHTVIGVAPASFHYPVYGAGVDAFLPHRPPSWSTRGSRYLSVLGKLRPGAPIERGRAQLEQVMARLEREYPDKQAGRGVEVKPLAEEMRGPVRQALMVLFAAVGVVLAIACANLVGLALARAAARRRDVSIRAALGASRAQLAREFLAESALLAVAGVVAGAALARTILALVAPFAAKSLPHFGRIALDGPAFLFLLALGAATAILFGLVPAFGASMESIGRDLVETSARSTGGRGRQRARQILVATQVALSVSLLVGAGLLLRTFFRLQSTSPGFDRVGALTLHFNPPKGAYDGDKVADELLAPLLERVRALPGVEQAGVISMLPVQAAGWGTSYTVDGLEAPPAGDDWWIETRVASPGAFEALRVPLVAGRLLAESDRPAPDAEGPRPYPCVVNEAFVRRHFPDGLALERVVRFSPDSSAVIVGVVGDTRQGGLDQESRPELTTSYADPRNGEVFLFDTVLVLRTSLEPASLTPAVRAAVAAVDPSLPIHTVQTLEQVVAESLGERRFHLLLIAAFAAVAVALAGTGLYALVAYLVAQRTREVGVRMALGATAGEIARWVMRDGLALAGAGLLVGLGGGWAASRLVASQLVGVRPLDPATWGAVIGFLVLVALAASYAPAARAARVDPIQVLRQE